MSQDLSQAFGRPATSSLRGLLPPRATGPRWSEPEVDEPEDDGLEDDGLEDDGLEDDGLEDEEGDDVEPDEAEPDEGDDVEPDDHEPDDVDEPEDGEPERVDDEPARPPVAPPREARPRPAARRSSAAPARPTCPTTASAAPRRAVRVTSRDRVDLLVLLALRQGPADGRGVITRLRATSGGVLDVPEQTVHVTLHRLARNRLLGRRPDPASRRRRYALTDAGERAARARLREWQALARGVDAVARHGEPS